VSYDCNSTRAIYRVDITIAQTADDYNKQHNDNVKLFDVDWQDIDSHYSCVSKAPNSAWCFVDTEAYDDTFSSMGPWRPYKQEIIGVNVITGQVRRLAHHRSRNIVCTGCIYGGYYYQPRISVSWDGTKVAWASNYGYNASPAEYADIYTLELPALAQFASAPGTRFLVAKAEAEDVDVGLDSTAKISSPDRSWKAEWQGPLVFAIPQTSPAIKRAN